jgi:hypothetical protein
MPLLRVNQIQNVLPKQVIRLITIALDRIVDEYDLAVRVQAEDDIRDIPDNGIQSFF